ncbi:MAG: hypothetical protein U9Q81_24295 [Pseudomonadota bacterium]|nr:hypothetical protein [Pseudomonadota bacterium]
MARHYNTKKFFRQSPNALLARYFKRHRVLRDFDFTKLKEGNPDPLFAAWLGLPEKQRAKMEADFQAIFALSCEAGTKAIIDEARYWTVTVEGEPIEPFIDWISGLKNHYDRAFQTFLKHPKYWRGATNFHYADTLSWWRKRKGLPNVSAHSDKASLDQLAELISSYFHAEGKGENCFVDPLRRNELDYFFAYPEDYSQRSNEWVHNQFKPRPHNPAFEIIFVYSEKEGSLDLHYRGDRKAMEPLQSFFCEAILKLGELPTDPEDTRVYDLNPLRQRDFAFQIEPGSAVQDIRITKLRLSSCLRKGDRVNLEADTKTDRHAIHDLMDQVAKGLPLKYYNVTRVDFAAEVIVNADKPAKNVPFHVTHPNSCSLKYDDTGRLLREMLKRSGIEPKEPDTSEDDAE